MEVGIFRRRNLGGEGRLVEVEMRFFGGKRIRKRLRDSVIGGERVKGLRRYFVNFGEGKGFRGVVSCIYRFCIN